MQNNLEEVTAVVDDTVRTVQTSNNNLETNLMVAEYERDYLMQMMNAINAALPQPVRADHPGLGGDVEQYYKAIQTKVLNYFEAVEDDPALAHNIVADQHND